MKRALDFVRSNDITHARGMQNGGRNETMAVN